MNDVLKTVSKFMFYGLVLALFIWTSSLTVSLAGRLFPGNNILPWFCLALFDVGALVWLLVFMKQAEGLPQRAISLMAFTLDLLGICFVSFAELFLGGQQLTAVPEGLGTYVIWTVGAFTILNLAAAYLFHLTDPGEMQEIRLQSLRDNVKAEALSQVEAQITVEAQQLAGVIRERIYADTLSSLRLPIPGDVQARLQAGNVIEGEVKDAPASPKRNPFPGWGKPKPVKVDSGNGNGQYNAEVAAVGEPVKNAGSGEAKP